MSNGVRGLLALVLVIVGLVPIVMGRPAEVLLGVATEIVAGVLFGINFRHTAKTP